jgi:Family of unknown function (DUF5681)
MSGRVKAGDSKGATDPAASYEVGYGRPPRHSRFKPGQSGNPKGRPKGSKSLKTLLEGALSLPITITECGVPRTITGAALPMQRASRDNNQGRPPRH